MEIVWKEAGNKVAELWKLCGNTVLFVALACPALAFASDIEGKIVGITDGDTLTVLRDLEQIKVRLAEIDTPEKAQPFGQRAKQSLSDMCFGRQARIEDKGHDRYGRTIGRVWCNGVDANAQQVQRGMAWVYDRYVTDRSLYALQDDARAARRGLWVDADPVRPWEWRKAKKNGGS
ncbi:MAG: thermonuclease family protein [Burkholderiales bacterium]